MPRVIGITGTIGSGKSTVGSMLCHLGIPVIDTDEIVHRLLSEDTPARRAVVARFGDQIVAADGSGAVDRARLAEIVFFDYKARKDLEAIVHPAVIREYRRLYATLSAERLVAVLVPLLFEAGIAGEFDEVWTVVTEEAILRQRLKERAGWSDEEISARLSAQWSQQDKASRSHRTIDNSGSLESTRHQVAMAVEQALKTTERLSEAGSG